MAPIALATMAIRRAASGLRPTAVTGRVMPGISASLDDMVAWETYIDATRDYSNGLYGRISVPQRSVDGNPAPYGYASRTERSPASR